MYCYCLFDPCSWQLIFYFLLLFQRWSSDNYAIVTTFVDQTTHSVTQALVHVIRGIYHLAENVTFNLVILFSLFCQGLFMNDCTLLHVFDIDI